MASLSQPQVHCGIAKNTRRSGIEQNQCSEKIIPHWNAVHFLTTSLTECGSLVFNDQKTPLALSDCIFVMDQHKTVTKSQYLQPQAIFWFLSANQQKLNTFLLMYYTNFLCQICITSRLGVQFYIKLLKIIFIHTFFIDFKLSTLINLDNFFFITKETYLSCFINSICKAKKKKISCDIHE